MSADVETMFSGEGHVPWWVGLTQEGEATVVEGLLTAAEAIPAAQLDWEVAKAEAFAWVEDDMVPIEKRYFTYRKSDNKVLSDGTVSDRYTCLQNAQLFSFLDAIVDSNDAHYVTAGSLQGGVTVWVLLKVNKDQVRIGTDQFEDYIVATTRHDGSGAVIVKPCRTRIVCWNTFSMAMGERSASFRAAHTAAIQGRVAEARAAMDLSVAWFDEFDEEVKQLLEVELTNDKFHDIVLDMFPLKDEHGEEVKGAAKTMRLNAHEFIFDAYSHEANAAFRGTGWGGVQAVNGYEQWGQNVRGSRSERQALKMLSGSSGFPLTSQARNILLEEVKA